MPLNQGQPSDNKQENIVSIGEFIESKLNSKVFGKIDFKENSKSDHFPPFVRLGTKVSLQDVKNLMLEYWKLPDPKLIVSIVGGDKRSRFANSRMSQLFKGALLKIATGTGAWVITRGTKGGVHDMVGDCMKEYMVSVGSPDKKQMSLIAIVSWESIYGRDRLEKRKNDLHQHDIPEIAYPIYKFQPEKGRQYLDPNHTNFILVDDGSIDKFDGEIEWRAEFEGYLSEHSLKFENTQEDLGHVPFITLLINGGDDCLKAVSKSLEKHPLVTIAGSQGAADVVVDLHHLMKKAGGVQNIIVKADEIDSIYKKHFSASPTESVMDCMSKICDQMNKVTVFNFERGMELDRTLLSALFPEKANVGLSERKSQLYLALALNRADFAREVTFNISDHDFTMFLQQVNFLNEIMIKALHEDKPDFIHLLAENGFDFQTFATRPTMERLYKTECEESNACSKYINRLRKNQEDLHRCRKQTCCLKVHGDKENNETNTYLLSVGHLIQNLIGFPYPNIYEKETIKGAQHMFFWAILFNRWELSRFFWKISEDHIDGAIVGAAILRGLSRKSNHREGTDITDLYHQNSVRFEDLASGIMEICWNMNRQSASLMLVRKPLSWGRVPLLEMAYHTKMEEFVAQSSCFSKLSEIWRGDIALRVQGWRLIMFSIIPLFLPLLNFVGRKESSGKKRKAVKTGDAEERDSEAIRLVSWMRDDQHSIPWFCALKQAFNAPIVKCIHHSIYYFTFLIVYSIFLMTELPGDVMEVKEFNNKTASFSKICLSLPIGCFEIITYCFVLTNFLDEIHQIFYFTTTSKIALCEKLRQWIRDGWNILDCLSYIALLVAIGLRIGSSWNENSSDVVFAARVFYSLSFLVYLTRFAQLFLVFEKLGPKIIMIKEMMIDMAFFFVILIMAILAVGVISEAIENPGAELNIKILWTILYKRYFQIYGDLFLDQFSTEYYSVILALYCMFVNTLLMNLLIAMFSNTYLSVQARSQKLWKYNYYLVVKEHFDRPHLLLFGTMLKIIGTIIKSKLSSNKVTTDFCQRINKEANENISKFVKFSMEMYMIQEDEKERPDVNPQVYQNIEQPDDLVAQLENLKSEMTKMQKEVLKAINQTSMERQAYAGRVNIATQKKV